VRFRKKPIEIEAYQFNGPTSWVSVPYEFGKSVFPDTSDGSWRICTLEGELTVSKGDWIIKGIKGEFYPCKPDIFEMTYDPVDPAQKSGEE